MKSHDLPDPVLMLWGGNCSNSRTLSETAAVSAEP